MAHSNNAGSKKSMTAAFLIGAVAGGVAALLLTPRTGTQVRGRLKQGARDLHERSSHLAEEAGEKAGTVKGAASEARIAYRDEMEKRRTTSPRSAVEQGEQA